MDDVTFWFGGWEAIVRVVVIGTLGYVTLLLLLRASGQRTLTRMTPFDFVLTVTLGSAFGRVLTATEVGMAEVVTTFAVLLALRWIIAGVRARWPAFGRVVTPRPSIVYHNGHFVPEALRRHRLLEDDVLIAARENGMGSLEEAYAVVLEPDGMFAVISPQQLGDESALQPAVHR